MEAKKEEVCRFFTTDTGCRKGKSCRWSHVMDDQKRCWTCGAKDHFATSCPRKEIDKSQDGKGTPDRKGGDGGKGGPRAARAVRKEDEITPNQQEAAGSTSQTSPTKEETNEDKQEAMKELLEEANKMLRMLHQEKGGAEGEKGREKKLERLQQQLDDLKSLKVFRVAKIQQGSTEGLLDSGATHALRGRYPGEDVSSYKEVRVVLACGREAHLHMTQGGTMIHTSPETEPIVPLGKLVGRVGCRVDWDKRGVAIHHPARGRLPVENRGGCPHITKALALELIRELEEKEEAELRKMVSEGEDEEERILRELIQSHPVLSRLPGHLQEALTVRPAQDLKGIPNTNKRRRKRMQKHGFTVHLFAGPEEGFTLQRAVQEAGGDTNLLVEMDILRGEDQDLTKNQPYASLLRAALDDQLNCVIAGPNCRTRSVLRHIPVSQEFHGPRPLRRWDGEEFGIEDLSEEERKKVEDDDVMMWRSLFIYILATHVRRAEKEEGKEKVRLLLEQPASPENHPEVVSIWRTREWKRLEELYDLETTTFNQGDWGGEGVPVKPTTVGGDLGIEVPATSNRQARSRGNQPRGSSKDLSRWVPGFMRAVAKALVRVVEKKRPTVKVLSWEEHVAHGHIPFRKDCWLCQEASAKGKPHRRLGNKVRGGVLSVDTTGPLVSGEDVTGSGLKFLLVGAFTWVVPKASPLKEDKDVEEEGEDFPMIEEDDGEEEEEGKEDEKKPKRGRPRKQRPSEEEPDADEEVYRKWQQGEDIFEDGDKEPLEKDSGEGRQEEETAEPEEDSGGPEENFEVKVFRMAVPVKSKKSDEVLQAVVDMIMRLKADGFNVVQVHTDNGGEFTSALMKRWMFNRGYMRTYTAGDDPQSNGRAENSVQQAKSQIRRLLQQGGMEPRMWPLAARHLNEVWRYQRIGMEQDFPPLNAEVLVKKRHWNSHQLSTTMEKVKYVSPNYWSHGHWVKKEENYFTTRYVISKVWNPVTDHTWIALEEQQREPLEVRRRIREKSSAGGSVGGRAGSSVPRVSKMIQEEMTTLLEEEDEEQTQMTLRSVGRLRTFVEGQTEEEILQTKIVGMSEVLANQEDWRVPIQAELTSLLIEKEALKELAGEEKRKFFQKATEENRKIEVVPGKLVPTIKPSPGGGKKKARVVACGNFTAKDAQDDLYAGTGDVVTFRLMLQYAAEKKWSGLTMNIRTAFLNTPWDDEDVLVKPPSLLVRMGLVSEGVLWQPTKALYGFRKSPRLWGCHRDSVLRGKMMKIRGKDWRMTQFLSEPNLWKVTENDLQKEEGEETIHDVKAMMLVYVDDIFIVGEDDMVEEVKKVIQEEWKTSTPEPVEEEPVRFLGMEVSRKNGVWLATQTNYIKDLLKRNLGDDESKWPRRKIPFSKDSPRDIPEIPTPEKVKAAQKAVGELLWLVTRTRPDLMYAVSRLSSASLSQPGWVVEAAHQVWGYLASTLNEGVRYQGGGEKDQWEEGCGIESYADASFAPGGEESHGAVLVTLRGGPLLWKSGRQSTVSLSTAEAELNELIEGLMVGESVATVVEEIEPMVPKVMVTDSQAAVGICMSDGGSWRTRHLRLRAAHAKQRFTKGDWLLKHRGGEDMLADIGTKPLQASRQRYLKKGLNMGGHEEEGEMVEAREEREVRSEERVKKEDIEKILKMVVLIAITDLAKAQEEEEKEDDWRWAVVFWGMVGLAAIGGWFVVVGIYRTVKKRMHRPEPEEEPVEPPMIQPMIEEMGGPMETPRRRSLESTPFSSRGPIETPTRRSLDSTPFSSPGGEGGETRRITYVTRTPTRMTPERPSSSNQREPDREPGAMGEVVETVVYEEVFRRAEVSRVGANQQEESRSEVRYRGKGTGKGGLPSEIPRTRHELEPNPRGVEVLAERDPRDGGVFRGMLEGYGSGGNPGVPPVPQGQRREDRVYITKWGRKYHTSTRCPSLSQSRLELSVWCPQCGVGRGTDLPRLVFAHGIGSQVHQDRTCRASFGSTSYRRCTLCHGLA